MHHTAQRHDEHKKRSERRNRGHCPRASTFLKVPLRCHHQNAEILNYPWKELLSLTLSLDFAVHTLTIRFLAMPCVATGGVNVQASRERDDENRIKDKTLISFVLRKDMAFNTLLSGSVIGRNPSWELRGGGWSEEALKEIENRKVF